MKMLTSNLLVRHLLLGVSLLAVVRAQEFRHDIYAFGNSFTSFNSFLQRVKYYYQARKWPDGKKPKIETPRHSPGGANLWTHWHYMMNDPQGRAPDFTEDNWGFVIIQDQSAAPSVPHWRDSQSFAAQRLVDYPKNGNVPVIFMATWGYRGGFRAHGLNYTYTQHTAEIFKGYQQYVEETSSEDYPTYVAPCGFAWQIIHDDCVAAGKDPSGRDCFWRELYRSDGSHPKGPGTNLCAMTIAVAMTGVSPYAMWYDPTYPEETDGKLWGDLIKNAVYRVITETKDSGLIKYPWEGELWLPKDPEKIWRPLPPPSAAPTTAPPSPSPTPRPTVTPLPPITVNVFLLGEGRVINFGLLTRLEPCFENILPHADLVPTFDKGSERTLKQHYQGEYKSHVPTVAYDWVVLQEATKTASQRNYNPCECLGNLIDLLGGTNTLFMQPWAYKHGFGEMNFTTQSTNLLLSTLALVEEANNAGFTTYMAPVGLAFEIVQLDCQEGLGCMGLWQGNGMNANGNGLYLAAITTVAAMTGIDPDAIGYREGVSKDEAERLQDAARRAILYTIDKELVTYPWDTSEWATTDYSD